MRGGAEAGRERPNSIRSSAFFPPPPFQLGQAELAAARAAGRATVEVPLPGGAGLLRVTPGQETATHPETGALYAVKWAQDEAGRLVALGAALLAAAQQPHCEPPAPPRVSDAGSFSSASTSAFAAAVVVESGGLGACAAAPERRAPAGSRLRAQWPPPARDLGGSHALRWGDGDAWGAAEPDIEAGGPQAPAAAPLPLPQQPPPPPPAPRSPYARVHDWLLAAVAATGGHPSSGGGAHSPRAGGRRAHSSGGASAAASSLGARAAVLQARRSLGGALHGAAAANAGANPGLYRP